MYTQLDNGIQLRINEADIIKDYFVAKIQEKETMSKKFSKYCAAFDYFSKTLHVLSALSGGVCSVSFAVANGAPVGITSKSLGLVLYISSGIAKILLTCFR